MLLDGKIYPKFIENWGISDVCGEKDLLKICLKGKLGKFEGVGSTLDIARKR